MDSKVINVLMIANGGKSFGGVENFFLQYSRHIDQQLVHWDFGFCRGNSLTDRIDDPAFFNSKFYLISDFKHKFAILNYIMLYFDLRKILNNNKYDIVHVNTGIIYVQISCLAAAKSMKVPVLISHSHSTLKSAPSGNFISSKLKLIYRKYMRRYVTRWSSRCLACGKEAGEQLFGKGNFSILPNAFEVDNYTYNKDIRIRMRNALGINNECIVIGTVGRLTEVKNPFFSLEVFKAVHDINTNSVFLMIGNGNLLKKLKKQALELEISECVLFLGARDDVPQLLQAMDGYIMPSIYEGLSVAAIEAQAAGLPCILSDTIPKETALTQNTTFLSINDNPMSWAKRITEMINSSSRDERTISSIKEAGYDITEAAKKLCGIYIEEYNNVRG